MDGHLIMQGLALIFSIIGAMWVYEQSIQRRFKTVWEKKDMQEKLLQEEREKDQKIYFDTFVNKEIYNNDRMHEKEKIDDRFLQITQLFNVMFSSLEKKVDDLKQTIKDCSTVHNNRNHEKS